MAYQSSRVGVGECSRKYMSTRHIRGLVAYMVHLLVSGSSSLHVFVPGMTGSPRGGDMLLQHVALSHSHGNILYLISRGRLVISTEPVQDLREVPVVIPR